MSADLVPYLGTVLPEDLAPVWFGPRGWGTPGMDAGIQALWRFPNDLGASVILNRYSYGVELAVIRWRGPTERKDYRITYDTPVTDDVLGHLSPAQLVDALRAIRALPDAPRNELEAGHE